ncbi:MAG: LPS assembly lipoprotein LptE [Gammaproteobacteria bacterium]|nr:LPS assembly lipoprotein LptE [Gammaproteobacteria bacterium]MDX5374195.1 LPS assembly lipoprotein LptE [Gammaproteobacteria bacterium]
MSRYVPRLVFVLLAVLLAAGCGFQLRGAANLPPEMARTYISGLDARDVLFLELKRQLRAMGVEVVDGPEQATAQLRFLERRDTRRVLSVGNQATVREYELMTSVRFDARGIGNDFRRDPVTLTATRELSFDETNVHSTAGEEALLREDMQRDMVQRVLRRLETH